MEAQFLDHYNRELGYLRGLGGEFAKEYPAVAGRLGLDEFSCADPYVERLLEGFAFLAARVHRRLDAEFPRLTGGLLESIYPHYTRPIPAAAIVALKPDPDEGALAAGYRLPKGTKLRGPSNQRSPTPVRFETTSELDLWPLELTNVELLDRESSGGQVLPSAMHQANVKSCLRITLATTAGLSISALQMDRLSIHVRGGEVAHRLFELLSTRTEAVTAGHGEDSEYRNLGKASIIPGGFDATDSLLPAEPRSFSGYRLLQEYFLLPEKFLFFDITGLKSATTLVDGKELHILIGLSESDQDLVGRLRSDHLALHCVPAVNLFKKRADRIQISDTNHEHQLLVDRSRPMDFEIWSVDQLHGHGKTPQQEIEFLPLYAPPTQTANRRDHAAYYTLERKPRLASIQQRELGHRSPYLGTEVFVTLTDSNERPSRHQIRQLSSTVHCTNRDLALLKPHGGWNTAFTMEGPGPVIEVACLTGPTPPRSPLTMADGEQCWRLINHLQTNLLSLSGLPDQPADAVSSAALLREMLYLYCPQDAPATRRQVDGVVSVATNTVTRQLPFAGPIVHGRGVSVELELDESAFEGTGAFLLASVVDRFMSQFVTLNSFTQTAFQTPTRGPVHRWPVRAGTSLLI